MDKIIIEGEEFEVKNGYPMIAPFMFYELDEIDEMVEVSVDDANKSARPGSVYLYLRNLEDSNIMKSVISTSWNGKGRCPYSDDIRGMENIFKIIVG